MGEFRRRLLVATLMLGLTACSGGGGGDEEAEKTLRVTNVQVPTLDRDLYTGYAGFPDIEVRFDFGGDLARMVGRTFYASFEDPGGLFVGPADLTISYATGRGHRIAVRQNWFFNQRRPPGLLQAWVRLRVCYDAACLEPVAGDSTITIPYSLRIRPGAALAVPEAPIVLPFGELLPERFIPLRTPSEVTVERFDVPENPPIRCVIICPRGFSFWRVFDSVLTGADAGLKVATRRPMPLGTYELPMSVEARGATASGSVPAGSRSSLRVQVVANPAIAVVVQPSAMDHVLRDGDDSVGGTAFVLADDGLTFGISRIEYLPAQPEEGRDGTELQWVGQAIADEVDYFRIGSQRCVLVFPIPGNFSVFERRCLPPGRYEAVVHFGNGVREVRLPIRLRVEGAPPPPR